MCIEWKFLCEMENTAEFEGVFKIIPSLSNLLRFWTYYNMYMTISVLLLEVYRHPTTKYFLLSIKIGIGLEVGTILCVCVCVPFSCTIPNAKSIPLYRL